MYGCEPYIQFSTPELFCILTLAAAKAFSLPPAATGITGGFFLVKKRTRRGALSVLLIFRSGQCVNRKVNRNTTVRIAVTMLMSLILPVQSLMSVYEMKPAAIP